MLVWVIYTCSAMNWPHADVNSKPACFLSSVSQVSSKGECVSAPGLHHANVFPPKVIPLCALAGGCRGWPWPIWPPARSLIPFDVWFRKELVVLRLVGRASEGHASIDSPFCKYRSECGTTEGGCARCVTNLASVGRAS